MTILTNLSPLSLIWEKAVTSIHRGVNITGNSEGSNECIWIPGPLSVYDIGLYAGLYDDTGHRTLSGWWNNITGAEIRQFSDKELKVYVY